MRAPVTAYRQMVFVQENSAGLAKLHEAREVSHDSDYLQVKPAFCGYADA